MGIVIGVLVVLVIIVVAIIIVVFAMRKRGSENIESRHKAAESQTAQALQMPMLYKQQQRISTTTDGVIQNPAFQYQSPQTVDQPRITKLNGNTEVADKSAITRLSDVH